MKLSLLRKNPNVCFEVDIMMDMANWQSVVVRGRFEELNGDAAEKARLVLYNRVFPLMTSTTIHGEQYGEKNQLNDVNRLEPSLYRILIDKKTGRFEKR